MSIKSNYLKFNKDDFDKYLDDLKRSSNSIHLLDEKFFFNQSVDISNMLIILNKKIIELDFIINSLTEFSKKQIIQSFMIDEIESTNKIALFTIEEVFAWASFFVLVKTAFKCSINKESVHTVALHKITFEKGIADRHSSSVIFSEEINIGTKASLSVLRMVMISSAFNVSATIKSGTKLMVRLPIKLMEEITSVSFSLERTLSRAE